MMLTVAGRDRSQELGAVLAAQAQDMAGHSDAIPALETFHSALILREAETTAGYLENLIDLMVLKAGGSTEDFYIPRRPGWRGRFSAALKTALWRLLRYQHERVFFQQNAVNVNMAVAMQFMRSEYEEELRALRVRVEELERKGGRPPAPGAQPGGGR